MSSLGLDRDGKFFLETRSASLIVHLPTPKVLSVKAGCLNIIMAKTISCGEFKHNLINYISLHWEESVYVDSSGFWVGTTKKWRRLQSSMQKVNTSYWTGAAKNIWNRPYQYMRMTTVGIRLTALSWNLWVNALCSLINSSWFLNWYDLASASISMFVFNILLQVAIEPLQKEPWTWHLCLHSIEAISKQ